MIEMTPTVAIIGSGPSGCYCAQFLRKSLPVAEITVFEALPVPYGLLRYGVAADHQGTKAVSAQFERMFTRNNVRFAGNVCIGNDLTLQDLEENFDIVVIATGLNTDRLMGIPGDNLECVIGAGRLLRAINGYPQQIEHFPRKIDALGERVVVVGNGNVAMDIIRLISKTERELIGSDINDSIRKELAVDKIKCIDVIGRSSIETAKFDLSMLREICHLKNAKIRWPHKPSSCLGPAADLLLSSECNVNDEKSTLVINFHFGLSPLLLSKRNENTVLTLKNVSDGTVIDLNCDSIITAVGFCQSDKDNLVPSKGMYSVGWARRGPKGSVAENRKDASEISSKIIEDLISGRINLGKSGYSAIEEKIYKKSISFERWKILDKHEIQSAINGRCRTKLTSIEEMLLIMNATVPALD